MVKNHLDAERAGAELKPDLSPLAVTQTATKPFSHMLCLDSWSLVISIFETDQVCGQRHTAEIDFSPKQGIIERLADGGQWV
jgi:hypothetical protein